MTTGRRAAAIVARDASSALIIPVRTARQLHLFQEAAVRVLASAVPLARWERIKLPLSLQRSGKVNETPVWDVSHS